MARTEPTTRLTTASAQMTGVQSTRYRSKVIVKTRISAANAATFDADAMNAVIGVGAPWYTSGVHTWNGAADTLNPRPTRRRAKPASSSPFDSSTFCERNALIDDRFVEPVAPYTSAMP